MADGTGRYYVMAATLNVYSDTTARFTVTSITNGPVSMYVENSNGNDGILCETLDSAETTTINTGSAVSFNLEAATISSGITLSLDPATNGAFGSLIVSIAALTVNIPITGRIGLTLPGYNENYIGLGVT